MEAVPSIRPLRACLFLDGSIEAEVAVRGVVLPVKLSLGRSAPPWQCWGRADRHRPQPSTRGSVRRRMPR
jgi:hypothetical protein